MKKRFITIKLGQFLSDIMDIIPSNCIINKVLTGIGATTLEIQCARNSIIIEPNVPVIKGKRKAIKDVLGVCEGIFVPDIKAYLQNPDIEYKKILTTPESFLKVKQAIEELDYDLYLDFFMLIDECDRLTSDIDYRESITIPLDDFFKFKNKAMISATAREISDKRFTDHFTVIEINPDFNFSTPLEIIETNNPKSAFKMLIDTLKEKEDDTPVCIFFNSIDGVLSLISELQIADQTSIFCSEQGEDKIRKNLVTVSTDISPSKMHKYNFFTARFFAAVDVELDYKPHVVYLTDLNVAMHSILDPHSDIIQIKGRFRNGINTLTQITNFNEDIPHLSRQEAEMFLDVNKNIYRTIQTLRDTSHSELESKIISELLGSIFFSRFYGTDGEFNNFMYDNYLLNEAKKGYYRSIEDLEREMANPNLSRHFTPSFRKMHFEFDSVYTNNMDYRITLHEVVVQVADILDELSNNYSQYLLAFDNRNSVYQEIRKRHPYIVDAYETLGYDRLVQHGYSKELIAKEIRKREKELGIENLGFRKELNLCFETGKYYRQTELLDKFQELYTSYKLPFKREISEFERFFEIGSLRSTPYPKCRLVIAKKFND